MINIVAGLPGYGKTAFLARKIRTEWLPQGETVYSYEKLRFKDDRVRYFHDIGEIETLKRCVIVLDEAQIWFNSRNWDSLPTSLQYALQQHRHAGVDIWGTVQSVNRIDTVMRELVQHYYEIKRVAGTTIKRKGTEILYPKKPWQLSWVREYDIMRANNVTRSVGSSVFDVFKGWTLFTKADFDFYDTLNEYRPENSAGDFIVEEVKTWTCRTCGHRAFKNPR